MSTEPVVTPAKPPARARRAVSNPMPALPPMMTTVWPTNAGSILPLLRVFVGDTASGCEPARSGRGALR